MCLLVRNGGKRTREGVRNGVGRHERMKRGNGMKVRDERSRGIEIHIVGVFTIIKPTAPFKLDMTVTHIYVFPLPITLSVVLTKKM